MPFRDPVSFLVLPPGAMPPVVGQPIIVLDPGPPPSLKFFTGDADEDSPGAIFSQAFVTGEMILTLLSPIHDSGINASSLQLMSGTDAAPDATEIRLVASIVIVEGNINVSGDLTVESLPVPYRVATTEETTNSGAIGTTETTVISVTGALITGKRYRIRIAFPVQASVNGDDGVVNIREDSATGTLLTTYAFDVPIAARVEPVILEVEFPAASTGNKTFVATLDTIVGAGTMTMVASAARPAYMYVDYVRG